MEIKNISPQCAHSHLAVNLLCLLRETPSPPCSEGTANHEAVFSSIFPIKTMHVHTDLHCLLPSLQLHIIKNISQCPDASDNWPSHTALVPDVPTYIDQINSRLAPRFIGDASYISLVNAQISIGNEVYGYFFLSGLSCLRGRWFTVLLCGMSERDESG